ncbi:glucose dehydrogenase [Kushneria sp. AK178]
MNASKADPGHKPVKTGKGWRIANIVVSIALALFGLFLLAGGIWLIALGGSWYYALTGAGCLVTAFLLFRQRRNALYLFAFIWLCTVIWALWEVGLDWWGLVPRLVAMTVILVLIVLLMPTLHRANAAAR